MNVTGETHNQSPARVGFALFTSALAAAVAMLLVGSPRPATARGSAGQQATPQQPAAIGTFTGDAAFVLNYIKTGKAADFEAVMAKVKEALQTSVLAERKEQAAGWKIYKSNDGAGEGQVLYISVISPVVRTADYSVPVILSEAFLTDVRALYDRYVASFGTGQERINATLLGSRAGAASN